MLAQPIMTMRVPIGIDDFRKLRERQLVYVDKTQLIVELIDQAGAEVVLLPRPRRFGKTLNLSMLRCFFEKRAEDMSGLFEGLAVASAGDAYREHFQRYPVIALTFKGIKQDGYEACFRAIKAKIEILFDEHRYLLDGGHLSEREAAEYQEVLARSANENVYERALGDMSRYLRRHHGERVVILIDEYDEPIHAGYIHGYAREVLGFFRAFLSEGLKGNAHLFKAVLTGILRIARESTFSGLNNLAVYSLLRSEFSSCFGFTEPEVERLLAEAGRSDRIGDVRHWYNGYNFGGTVVYNPWSVLNFLADERAQARPYWLSTSSNDLIKQMLEVWGPQIEPTMEALLAGGGLERVLDENVVLDELLVREDALWSLLVFSGYLKAEERSRGLSETPSHFLSIPNREVRLLYAGTFQDWMRTRLTERGGNADRLVRALFAGDAEGLEDELSALCEAVLSYHDKGVRSAEPLYHGFILGLLTMLEADYEVRSNRESGEGRPDVLVRPRRPGQPGVVLELKVARPGKKTLEQALDEGVAQSVLRRYATRPSNIRSMRSRAKGGRAQ